MSLEQKLEQIREDLQHGKFKTEASVSQWIVLPTLDELGWPVANRAHPWWDLPQDLATQVAYKEWWAAKGMDSTFGYLG